MGRGKSIDKNLKNDLYYQFYEDAARTTKVTNIFNDTYETVKQYVNKHELKGDMPFIRIYNELYVDKGKVLEYITNDIVFNLYEHIHIIKKEIDLNCCENPEDENLILLRKYCRGKSKSYRERLKKALCSDKSYSLYKGHQISGLDNYYIPKFSDLYVNYIFHTRDNDEGTLGYVDESYSPILDFLYNMEANELNRQLRSYCIWQIDSSWLPEIEKLYAECEDLPLYLVEKLYKLISAKKIHSLKTDFYDKVVISNIIQPLSMFGYGECMELLISRYSPARAKNYVTYARCLFDTMSSVFDTMLHRILNYLWSFPTSKEKEKYISKLYDEYLGTEYAPEKCTLVLNNVRKRYKEVLVIDTEFDDEFLEICKCLLFNGKFKRNNESDVHAFRLGYDEYKNDEGEEDEYEEYDDEYEYDVNFDFSFTFGAMECFVEAFYDSVDYEYTDDEEDEVDDLFDFNEKDYYMNLAFSDYLYIITECKYDDFFEEEK